MLADSIAFLAIYTPIIRAVCYTFARLWNAHKIRKQAKRPGVITGKPNVLFYHPEPPAVDRGRPINREAVEGLRASLLEFGKLWN